MAALQENTVFYNLKVQIYFGADLKSTELHVKCICVYTAYYILCIIN